MSQQVLSDEEKATLSRFYSYEGEELPIRCDVDDACLKRRQRRRRTVHFIALSLLIIFIVQNWPNWTASSRSTADHTGNSSPFEWSSVTPSEVFDWRKCFGKFQCAKLSVPLDYSNPSGSKAAVAIIKLPANLTSSSKKYGGPVLINPGGPGGSGVETLLIFGKQLQTIIGENFDVVSFDPRGVGLTTPSFYAFANKNEAGLFYADYPRSFNSSTDSIGRAYAYSNILGKRLEETTRNVTEYVSTPLVARDMLRMSKAMGYDKLQYWGFSYVLYGSVLGATFSAMFPDNVGRVVLDGVVDSENYYAGLWSNNLIDTEAALLDICSACVSAGPSRCFLYESSPELVLQRIENILEKLKLSPIPVFGLPGPPNANSTYGIVDYAVVKTLILVMLYNTHFSGELLVNMLASLEIGMAQFWLPFTSGQSLRQLLTCDCPAPGHEPPPFDGGLERTLAIACGDNMIEEESLSEVRSVYDDIAELSSFADVWGIHVACSGWKVKGKERFKGTFNQKTSHPLLLIGNTADPVTPLWAAQKMSKGFEGSVVLIQNSSGHCSISATSLCTHKAIRAYFQDGTLPENGTVCETESKIFPTWSLLDDVDTSAMSAEDIAILEASYTLQKNYFVPRNVMALPNTMNWRL
ncbi:alpha/beta-hydrolase [Schizopora paradoxa]|uniref:Alpha/beta-hydrolase n=1 Tax=Schizopora paradoxa TaxID=27342 RepID=A0A0H2RLS5_9AGAM|nr:alpha/beta-hydrolase [Schizopora paradoxa]